jgi:hypothetical protein
MGSGSKRNDDLRLIIGLALLSAFALAFAEVARRCGRTVDPTIQPLLVKPRLSTSSRPVARVTPSSAVTCRTFGGQVVSGILTTDRRNSRR